MFCSKFLHWGDFNKSNNGSTRQHSGLPLLYHTLRQLYLKCFIHKNLIIKEKFELFFLMDVVKLYKKEFRIEITRNSTPCAFHNEQSTILHFLLFCVMLLLLNKVLFNQSPNLHSLCTSSKLASVNVNKVFIMSFVKIYLVDNI